MTLSIVRCWLPLPVTASDAVVGETALLGVVPCPDRKLLSVCIAELLTSRSIVGNAHLNAGDVALVTRGTHSDGIDVLHGKPSIIGSSRAHHCDQEESKPHGL
jgi:hypothetical protein